MQKSLEISDEDNYRKMSKPFDDADSADKALHAFYADLRELRQKHGLADVSVIVKDAIVGSGVFMWSAHSGSQMECEAMAAWHLGQMSADRQEMIRKAMDLGAKQAIKK